MPLVSCMTHRVLRLRDHWNRKDDNLVISNRITKHGLASYWKALDASFAFNLKKRADYLIRMKFRALKGKNSEDKQNNDYGQTKTSAREDITHAMADEMINFFRRHSSSPNHRNDRFHWHSRSTNRKSPGPRFLLPRVNFKS